MSRKNKTQAAQVETVNPVNPETVETVNPNPVNPETINPETVQPETVNPETVTDGQNEEFLLYNEEFQLMYNEAIKVTVSSDGKKSMGEFAAMHGMSEDLTAKYALALWNYAIENLLEPEPLKKLIDNPIPFIWSMPLLIEANPNLVHASATNTANPRGSFTNQIPTYPTKLKYIMAWINTNMDIDNNWDMTKVKKTIKLSVTEMGQWLIDNEYATKKLLSSSTDKDIKKLYDSARDAEAKSKAEADAGSTETVQA